MKKLCIAVFAVGVVLSGCSDKETTIPPTDKTQEAKPSEKTPAPFTPIDESKYKGIQKEMVKLVNLHAKYANSRDEDKFKQLFHNQDYPLPGYEVRKLEVDEFTNLKETKGLVSIKATKYMIDRKTVEDRLSWFSISSNEKGEWKIDGID